VYAYPKSNVYGNAKSQVYGNPKSQVYGNFKSQVYGQSRSQVNGNPISCNPNSQVVVYIPGLQQMQKMRGTCLPKWEFWVMLVMKQEAISSEGQLE
jgi:hypothetical protein